LIDGGLRLLARDLAGPNALALSLDERCLYIRNWDDTRKVAMRLGRDRWSRRHAYPLIALRHE